MVYLSTAERTNWPRLIVNDDDPNLVAFELWQDANTKLATFLATEFDLKNLIYIAQDALRRQ